jgi:hypothetical protein
MSTRDNGEALTAPDQQTGDTSLDEAAAWEAAANRAAAELAGEVEGLEATLQESRPRSYRVFWENLRGLQERVRHAPAIKLDDKLALQSALRHLAERARQEQKEARQAAMAARSAMLERLELIREVVAQSTTTQDLQEARADLRLLRERLEQDAAALDRASREMIWSAWQATNQAAWDALNEVWGRNEAELRELLERARGRLAANDVQGAREGVKGFHASVTDLECSHRALRDLRALAGQIWQEADALAKQKHAAYLEHAGKRLEQWRNARARYDHSRRAIEQELNQLRAQAERAPTDVALALLRGQIAQKEKALAEIDREEDKLVQRIEAAESALARP